MVLHLLLAPLALFTVYRLCKLSKNYAAARKYRLPIIILPCSFEDAWWILLRPYFAWVQGLPWGFGDWYVYTEMGWPQVDTNKTSLRLGDNFVLCAPTANQIVTSYRPAIDTVFRDHKNWPQTDSQTQMFMVYGQNVASTNGVDWQRHRKITSTAFNENTMVQVWEEAIKRTAELDLSVESERSLGRLRSSIEVLAMRVLAQVAFGEKRALNSIPPGHRQSLMQCLGFIQKHIVLTILFSGLKAPDFLLPKKLRKLKVSVAEFRQYMEESLKRHLETTSKGSTTTKSKSLLESMVRANEAEKQLVEGGPGRVSYLSDSDLYGNLFVFNLAGYETTASTLTFALPFLATNPNVQEWVYEELKTHYINSSSREYATVYSKLVRCLSVMYEALRLASPAPLLVRSPRSPMELPIITKTGPGSITVNPGTLVGGHFYAGHLSPDWGSDAESFNPRRFILKSESGEESLAVPEGRLFAPWIFGQRVCPGKKFSQVEFTAIVAQIFANYRVKVIQNTNESAEEANQRMMGILSDKYFNISTHLKQPEAGALRFERRDEKS
ncbi:putative cytochrome P450 [Aaosphaeria arxii CBS 175.79]|uniref:Putative cytochrome P450 n=1 Tax=Aaosphaeria arxii CBS 175.79 TaxID=1450172 RepID=A0A6A5YAA6_9PLEO|nr:putative cytochrome P450 [Aaosphaeria arxii CBS 175.79]KAF2021514.1 putative cytochrome P450 [Aaosphaeria arxii CBS 175.79]